MATDRSKTTFRSALACLGLCLAIALAACGAGGSGSGDPGSGNPDSNLTAAQATAPLQRSAAPELVALNKQANQLIGDGDGFAQKIDSLKAAGIPIVINKWASWCGPCRAEFPDFQTAAKKYGDKIAFIGLDSNDGTDTAKTFLSEFPVPYPSYEDPDGSVANSIGANLGQPNTIFIDSSGETSYKQLGQFADSGDLDADIKKYAQ